MGSHFVQHDPGIHLVEGFDRVTFASHASLGHQRAGSKQDIIQTSRENKDISSGPGTPKSRHGLLERSESVTSSQLEILLSTLKVSAFSLYASDALYDIDRSLDVVNRHSHCFTIQSQSVVEIVIVPHDNPAKISEYFQVLKKLVRVFATRESMHKDLSISW